MSATFSPSSVPRFSRGVRLHKDTARNIWVLLAPERVLKPDEVAIEILRRVDGRTSLGAIVDDLCKAFSADRAQIKTDVETFLAGLAEKGFVEAGP